MKRTTIIWLIIGALIIAAIAGFGIYAASAPGKYDAFAKCLSAKKLTFFGAFWCPHCAEQKGLFGSSVQYLPYTECSTPDGQGQTQVCKDAGITGYPTWQLPDGSRLNGVVQLQTLSEKSGCPLPS
jgi:hypothetical protein